MATVRMVTPTSSRTHVTHKTNHVTQESQEVTASHEPDQTLVITDEVVCNYLDEIDAATLRGCLNGVQVAASHCEQRAKQWDTWASEAERFGWPEAERQAKALAQELRYMAAVVRGLVTP